MKTPLVEKPETSLSSGVRLSCFENEAFIDAAFASALGVLVFSLLTPASQKVLLQLRCRQTSSYRILSM